MKKITTLLIITLTSCVSMLVAQVPQYISTAGLQAFYPFTGNPNDASGNARDLSNYGGVLTTDRYGNANSAYNFDGTGSYMKRASFPALTNSLQTFAMSFWFKRNVTTGNTYMISRGIYYSNNNQRTGEVYAQGLTVTANKMIGLANSYASTTNYNATGWNHCVIDYDANGVYIFINGAMAAFTANSTGANNYVTDLVIAAGNDYGGITGNFNGVIDEVAIYDGALTTCQILDMYNSCTRTDPASQTIFEGGDATMSFTYSCYSSAGITYQWQANDGGGYENLSNAGPYTGVTTTTLNITNASTALNGALYRCVITAGSCSPKYTPAATLTVNSCTAPSAPNSATASPGNINTGESSTLAVNGGSLNSATDWVWYTGSCGGTQVGTGGSISVSPGTTTTYYVDASACGTSTTCRSVTVTVCAPPVAPTSASASPGTINAGESSTIYINGGALNAAPNWVWHTGSCSGPEVGTGTSLAVSPTTTTTYYVNATGCGTSTTCRTVTVTVNACTAPISPTGATASQTSINAGEATTLQVNGGSLNDASNWVWYTGSCGGTQVGTGSSLVVSPTTTTTYYVNATACSTTTTCRSVTINVNTTPPPAWVLIRNDASGDGFDGALMDGTKLEYKYDATADSLFFRITVAAMSSAQSQDVGFNVMANYTGGGNTFLFWGDDNQTDPWHVFLTGWVTGSSPSSYTGTIGIADAAGVGANNYTSLHQNNLSIVTSTSSKTIEIGLKRSDFIPTSALNTPIKVAAAVGASTAWNDDIYNPSATMTLSTVGIADNEIKPQFSIYPNPATDWLYVKSDKSLKLAVTDIFGQTILELAQKTEGKIDISSLAAGVYLLHDVENGGTMRFMKQ